VDRSELKKWLWGKAIQALSRREYAVYELHQRLKREAEQDHDNVEPIISEILAALQAEGYISDQRYTEMLVRSRFQKGQGPIKVRQELKMQHVDSDLVSQQLTDAAYDWFEGAKKARMKRFGFQAVDDTKQRAKQMRFLAGRGFDQEQIDYALSCSSEEECR
jgi:regulatory protein